MRPVTRIVLAVAGIGFLTRVTLWMLSSGAPGRVNIATVLQFSVSVLTLAVAILGVQWQAATDEHKVLADKARALMESNTRSREAEQQQKFLADTGMCGPTNVDFKQANLVHWRSEGGKRYGSMEDIKNFYAGLRHRRLVILGPGGAGKTVLADQLILDLTDPHAPEYPLACRTISGACSHLAWRPSTPETTPTTPRQHRRVPA